MSRSRSLSRSSAKSLGGSQSGGFRTITRNRSNHQLIKETNLKQTRNEQNQSRLQKMLSLSKQRQMCKVEMKSSLSQRKVQNQKGLLIGDEQIKGSMMKSGSCFKTQKQSYFSEKMGQSQDLNSASRLQSGLNKTSNDNKVKVNSRLNKYDKIGEMQRIEQRLKDLVDKKLQTMQEHISSRSSRVTNLIDMKMAAIDSEIKDLLSELIKLKEMKNQNGSQGDIMNKKLQYIETILAEHNTERELMRKYYTGRYAGRTNTISVNSGTRQNKITKAVKNWSLFQKQYQRGKKDQNSPKKGVTLVHSTLNRASYKAPNPEDYVPPKVKAKAPPMNIQPLPRSCYKRDFLVLKSQPVELVIAEDNKAIFPRFLYQQNSSNYTKDFHTMKGTQIINHRNMDAFKDKLRFLKVSYMPKKQVDQVIEWSREKKRNAEKLQLLSLPKTINALRKSSQIESRFSKQMMVSEARREFVWGSGLQRSKIKDKQLKQLQYRLKNLYKA